MAREYPQTPLVGIGVVVLRGEEVLLIRRARPPRQGEWSLPGGLQQLGETVFDAAVREVREETAVLVRPLGVVACVSAGADERLPAMMAAAALAAGNVVVLCRPGEPPDTALSEALAAAGIPGGALTAVPAGSSASLGDLFADDRLSAVALAAPAAEVAAVARVLAQRDGPIVRLILCPEKPFASGGIGAPLAGTAAWFERFVHERTLTIDTTASGGNAALLALDE